jgi:hypothetical protein
MLARSQVIRYGCSSISMSITYKIPAKKRIEIATFLFKEIFIPHINGTGMNKMKKSSIECVKPKAWHI